MNASKLLLTLLLTGGLISSCSEQFINPINPAALTVASYYKTASDVRGGVTSAYSSLQLVYSYLYSLSEVPSDNSLSTADGNAIDQFDVFNLPTNQSYLFLSWQALYTSIAKANIVLDRAPGVTMDETLKSRYLAELKFIRAMNYFNLVRAWGDVPLILKALDNPDDALTYRRNPTAEVYAQIIKDLTEAETVLPAKYTGTDVGRATSIAAKTMLGEVYMTQKNWMGAAAKLKEAYDLAGTSGVTLLANFADIFNPVNGNNAEIIFAVQYQRNRQPVEGSNFANNFTLQSTADKVAKVGRNLGYNYPTQDLDNAFEAGDTRKPISVSSIVSGNLTLRFTSKYLDPNQTTDGDADNDWIVYRYADLLLLYAEALNETGNTTDALTQLNKVRSRAGLAARLNLNQTATRAAIEQERRVELCFEGHRWFDLVRTGRALDVVTAQIKTESAIPANVAGIDTRLKSRNYLFPIPEQERIINPALVQNPGY